MKSGFPIGLMLLCMVLFYACINSPNNRISDVPVMDGVMHTARPGETVDEIARTYEVSPQMLMRVNGLVSSADIPQTRRLFIPGADEVRVVEQAPMVVPTARVIAREEGVSHLVRSGETMIAIARAYEITLQELQRVNNLPDVSQLRVGQVLWVPRAKEVKDVEIPTVTIRTFEPTAAPTSEPRVVVKVVPTPTPKPVPPAEANLQQFPAEIKEYAGIRFQWPIKDSFRVVRPFSTSSNPHEENRGIDLGAPSGTSVFAAADGKVQSVGGFADTFGPEWGNYVILYHDDNQGKGIYTIYGHNSEILVKKDEQIKRGQEIAKMGNTGISPVSAGGALHFQVREGLDAINPIRVLPELQDN